MIFFLQIWLSYTWTWIRIQIRIQKNCWIQIRIKWMRIHSPDQGCGSTFIFCRSGSSCYPQCGSGSRCLSIFTSFLKIKVLLLLISLHFSVFFLKIYPPGSGYAYWMRLRIQEAKLMRIHADLDPKPWFLFILAASNLILGCQYFINILFPIQFVCSPADALAGSKSRFS